MEEKKQIKISLKMAIIIMISFIIVIVGVYFVINLISGDSYEKKRGEYNNIEIKTYNNRKYYIMKTDYLGEYDLQLSFLKDKSNITNFAKKELMSYSEYVYYCNEWDINPKYSDSSKNYIIFSYYAKGDTIAKLAEVEYYGNDVNLYIWDNVEMMMMPTPIYMGYVIVIPTEKNIQNINIIPTYTKEEYEYMKKRETTVDKPIIYLYPTEEKEITVKLLKEDKITCSYPKYVNRWKVLANPNGDLIDMDTQRKLYSLYYESETIEKFDISNDGFVVKGEDSAKFLEEKLAVLGLNEREAEEFIIYWLPKLESNKYNYIRFATEDEISNNMPLEINPKPDTIIRILMTFKGLEKPIEVTQQELITPERVGFTIVEWGGTEIK